MKKIEKTAQINATKEKVWNVLFNNQINHLWFDEFSPGTTTDTDWKTGSKAAFTNDKKSGIIGKIAASQPYEKMIIEYTGFVEGGVEDYDSEMAKTFNGAQEIYRLSDDNGGTRLDVSVDMGEEYYDMMSSQWDTAMKKITSLAEAK